MQISSRYLTTIAYIGLLSAPVLSQAVTYKGSFDGTFLGDDEISSLSGNWSASVTESAFEQARQESIDLGSNFYLYVPLDSLTINPASIGSRPIDLSNTEFALRFINGTMFEYYVGATYTNSYNTLIRANQIASPDDFRILYKSTNLQDLFADATINQVTYRVGTGIQRIASNPSGEFSVEPVPIPAAAWLFGSGLLGLLGIARRRKS